ncbi:MAG: UbiA family prenyltransferase [Jiangellales bacterium]
MPRPGVTVDGASPAPSARVTAKGLWRMSRPDQVLLVVAVYGTGVAAGAATNMISTWAGAAWALGALVGVAVSVHLVNEYADADTDAVTERTRFSGGSGALHDLGLDRRLPLRGAWASGGTGAALAALGMLAGQLSGVAVVLLLLGLLGGWLYSLGPRALSRLGWGEIANAVLGGLLLPLFGMSAVAGQVNLADLLIFAPFAVVVFVNLLETQWADRHADMQVGKMTLVTRLTSGQVQAVALACTLAAYGGLVVLVPDPIPVPVGAASLLALPFSVWAVASITRRRPLPAVLAMLVLLAAQAAAWVAQAAA